MNKPILKGMPTTASDWMFYSSMDGSNLAAIEMAKILSAAIIDNLKPEIALDKDAKIIARITVLNIGRTFLEQFAHFGALDGESESVLVHVVNKAFDWSM